MRRKIALFIAMLALIIGSQAEAQGLIPSHHKVNPKSSLLERHKEFIAATAKGNADGMARLVANDYTVTGADGQKADKAKALAAVRANQAGIEMADSDIEAHLVG